MIDKPSRRGKSTQITRFTQSCAGPGVISQSYGHKPNIDTVAESVIFRWSERISCMIRVQPLESIRCSPR